MRLALPDALTGAMPIWKPLSLKMTLPAGGGEPGEPVTVAVNVTGWPTTDGLTDEANVVLVVAIVTVRSTGALSLATKTWSPAYRARLLWLPMASEPVVSVALPEASTAALPIGVPLSVNVTTPPGVPSPPVLATVAVNVTG